MLWLKVKTSKLISAVCLFILAKILPPVGNALIATQRKAATTANALSNKASMRLSVCKQCPMYTSRSTCKSCGCYMPVKVQVESASCPEGRW
jgi:hypothetical protein